MEFGARAPTDIVALFFTSGTTGQPKGVVRDNGGHMVALHWTVKNIYGVEPGEVYWAASDVGWVVGHSDIVYAQLLHGSTTILFEGKPVGTPDAGVYWRVISDHKVKTLFTAPTALRAIKREDLLVKSFLNLSRIILWRMSNVWIYEMHVRMIFKFIMIYVGGSSHIL